MSGFYSYLLARGDTAATVNPVPRGLLTRNKSGSRHSTRAPLVRGADVPNDLVATRCRLLSALRTDRDRTMVLAMVLGGLRRCEVLGSASAICGSVRDACSSPEVKGGHHRVVAIANRFFTAVGNYLYAERPKPSATGRLFVVLKGPRGGQPLPAEDVGAILDSARCRAGLEHGTCHESRYTCLTRLREAQHRLSG